MNYFLLKLAFDTAVHFGGSDSAVGSQSSALTLRADTIFSALCHTALEVYGEPALEELLVSADADALRISDAMPWRGDTFYLPKPIAASTSPAELSTVERKAVKKLAWIPVSKFDRYTASLHTGTYPLDELDQSFGQAYEQTKASVTDGADAKPYFVGLYRPHAGCGLYVLCACEGNDQLKMLKELFTLLGLSGIGGCTRFSRFYQDAFLSHFPQGHPVANIPDTPHLILGGGTGFLSKTVGYSYLKDDYAAALKWTQRILQTQHGRHEADISLGVSPHRARYITYAGKRYPAGFCEVNIL